MEGKSRSSPGWPVVLLVATMIGAAVAWPAVAVAEDGGGGAGAGAGSGSGGSGGSGGGHGGHDSGHSGDADSSSGVGGAPFSGVATGGRAGSDPPYGSPGRSGRSAAPSDQDSAREAMLRGWVLPLEDVLANVRRSIPGDVLKVSLEQESNGAWVYALTVLTPEGRYRDIAVDAGNSQILRIKGH